MNKYSTLLIAGTVALGFASCRKDNTSGVTPANEVETYASIRAAEVLSPLKAGVNGQTDVQGVGAESRVTDGLFFVKDASYSVTGYTATGLGFEEKAEGYWQSPVFKYAGISGQDLQSALVLNSPVPVLSGADATSSFVIGQLSQLASVDKGFTMTSASSQKIEIKPNIKEVEVEAGRNRFDYTVERVVSKVQVVKSDDFKESLSGDLSDFRYSVAGSAKEVYAFRDHAGERTLSADPKVGYKDYISLIGNASVSAFDDQKQFATRRDLTRVSDGTDKNVVAKGAGEDWAVKHSLPMGIDPQYADASLDKGIYFLENSLPSSFVPTADNPYRYADITYVKVYAKYVPAEGEVFKLDGDRIVSATKEDVAQERTENIAVRASDGSEENRSFTYQSGSFFRAVQDGKLYLTLAAARQAGNTQTEFYDGGMMVWLTPANRQFDKDNTRLTVNVDTRRNNIYSICVTSVSKLGYNYDPLDPTDPNIPKPENPDEPLKPQDIPVDEHDPAIRVSFKLLNWNLVERNVTMTIPLN
ncbi:MAG: Mfa1 family fimbria major subunit [Porphyromonas sp.]|nr:Mfa1 family fimbria major subunit [Bacteroidales bacterium]MDY3100837.1 Mfa1 family fimbria major subunit [Porphyromonas sp.]